MGGQVAESMSENPVPSPRRPLFLLTVITGMGVLAFAVTTALVAVIWLLLRRRAALLGRRGIRDSR